MCSSVETTGHVYKDRADSEYRDMVGDLRMWQDCVGCGNVRNRRVAHFSHVKPVHFRRHFESARQDNPLIGANTSDYSTDPAARGTRYYLWSDGVSHAGFAVRADGELVYVFSTARGMGDAIVATAIEKGATHLDCFEGHLTDLYASHGFVETAREANWAPGAPDVVWMSR